MTRVLGEIYEILKADQHYFWDYHDRRIVKSDSAVSGSLRGLWIVFAVIRPVFRHYKIGTCGTDRESSFGFDASYVCARLRRPS